MADGRLLVSKKQFDHNHQTESIPLLYLPYIITMRKNEIGGFTGTVSILKLNIFDAVAFKVNIKTTIKCFHIFYNRFDNEITELQNCWFSLAYKLAVAFGQLPSWIRNDLQLNLDKPMTDIIIEKLKERVYVHHIYYNRKDYIEGQKRLVKNLHLAKFAGVLTTVSGVVCGLERAAAFFGYPAAASCCKYIREIDWAGSWEWLQNIFAKK